MYTYVIILHLLGAAVWTGGHLVLAVSILTGALMQRSITPIQQFEGIYERIGLPALIIQVATGIWLIQRFMPNAAAWSNWSSSWTQRVLIKLVLLLATLGLAIDARLRLIPKLDESRLNTLAWQYYRCHCHLGVVRHRRGWVSDWRVLVK